MYNLRYHIASLVAVFLALAMGLLLGTIVVDRGVISQQQAALVAGLQEDFNEIRQESAEMRRTNTTLTRFAAAVVPGVVEGALSTRTIVIIASPESAETADRAADIVRDAGGAVAVATFSDVDLGLMDEGVASAVGKALNLPAGSVTTSMVVDALSNEWRTAGDARLVTKALVGANALKMTGLPAAGSIGGTIVTCTFDGKADGAALLLGSALSDTLRASAGVETVARSTGLAAQAAERGLSAVDDIDTPMGQLSLTWILAQRASGSFGQGDGVDDPYPPRLFGEE